MSNSPRQPYVVVGVITDQPDEVVIQAGIIAEHFDAELVCATVDTSSNLTTSAQDRITPIAFAETVPTRRNGSVEPDFADRLVHLLSRTTVHWHLESLAGEPAHQLALLADELDAVCIVVGTRHPGFRSSAREFFTGSVAIRDPALTHPARTETTVGVTIP